jgi:uncharacterized lipoprotein YmbA
MNPRPNVYFCLLSSVACLLSIAGCNLVPEAQTDPTRFYVLSTPAVASAVEAGTKAPAIHLRPVELASYIKSKPMIVRRGDNEIEFREYARWGEPLELGIGRVLREELLARGAAGAVLAAGMRAVDVDYDYQLTVRVLACEGTADGAVLFRAVWELSTAGVAPKLVAHGDFHPTDFKWDGKSESALAAKLSDAVAALSGEIAAALAKAG